MTTIRKRSTLDSPVLDLCKRELGHFSTRSFAHRRAASENIVLRFDVLRTLDKHHGCVNTVSFNADGDILVSGSDDKRVILWDWETGEVKLSFYSDHKNNIFQAKFMPFTDDRSIVTCAADGQVRHAKILEGGVETKLVAEHQGRAHKLAIEPGSPHILYSCGEDGLVQHIDLRTDSATSLFTCKPVPGQTYFPIVNLNAITIDPRNPNLFAVGGSDQFARLFDIRQYKWDGSSEFGRPVEYFCPPHLIDENGEITGLAFSEESELLVSYNDEFIYLFTMDIGVIPEPFSSVDSNPANMTPDNNPGNDAKAAPQAYKGHRNCETVKGVSFFGPRSDYVVSGSDCGRIFIWKKKGGDLVRVMEADKHIVNCIQAHPHDTVLASSGIEHDIKMWIPKAIERFTLPTNIQKDRASGFLSRRPFGFFPFGGFYDDDDDDSDFINSDNEFIYIGDGGGEDEDDEYSESDDDTTDDDEDDEDDDSENEVLSGGYLEEENDEIEDNHTADCIVSGNSLRNGDGDINSAACEDSCIDICDDDDDDDADNCTEFADADNCTEFGDDDVDDGDESDK